MTGYYPSTDKEGGDFLLLVVKRSYDINLVEAKCEVCAEQDEVNFGDVYHGDEDPFKSSIKYESDVAPWKVKKDVIFVGKAYAPKGKKKKTWDVTLQVGGHKRKLRVFGPRTVSYVPAQENKKTKKLEPQPPIIGEPEAVAEVELTYENAYGGFATYYPEDPKIFRKAVRKEKKKAKKREEKEEAKKQAELDAIEDEKEREAAKAEAKKQEEARKSWFYHGMKKLSDAPDVEFEVELGSRKLKGSDGTQVLDLAEIAEAEKREAEEDAARLAEEKAALELLDGKSETGALIVDADELAKMAAEDAEEAAEDRAAYEAQRALEGDASERGTRVINLADMGDEITHDDSWIIEQKEEREEFYESLGLDPDTEVEWQEGDFPRIPCPTNFVGKGFALRNCEESLEGLQMPLVEDPKKLLKPEDLPIDPATLHLPTLPQPAGFGVVSRAWVPRSYMAGLTPNEIEEAQHKMDKMLVEDWDPEDEDDQQVIDALMNKEPTELNPLYYNAAVPAWQLDHIDGDEDVHLTNLDESGKTFFKLPDSRPFVRFDRGEGWEKVPVDLDTLIIDREAAKVLMLWRGAVQLRSGSVDEMDDYPHVDIDIQDMSMIEFRDREHDEQIAEALKDKGEALVLGEDEVSADEDAAFDDKIKQAATGMHGVYEEKASEQREKRAHDGALVDLQGGEDVIMSDDAWIGETQDAQLTEEEHKAKELERDEKKRIQAKKEPLKKKREDDERKKKEAEEEEAKKQKGKNNKKEAPPADDDDDEDDLDDDEPEAEVEPEPKKKAAPKKKKKPAPKKKPKKK